LELSRDYRKLRTSASVFEKAPSAAVVRAVTPTPKPIIDANPLLFSLERATCIHAAHLLNPRIRSVRIDLRPHAASSFLHSVILEKSSDADLLG
jgi:hypothetical protein